MKRALLLIIVAFCASCGGTTLPGATPEIQSYRDRAADNPTDPEAQMQALAAELFVGGGEPARVAPAQQRAMQLASANPSVHLLTAIDHDIHGRIDAAYSEYLRTIVLAISSGTDDHQGVAAAALGSVEDLIDVVPNGPARAQTALAPLLNQTAHMSPSVRFEIANVLMDVAFRRGQLEEARRLASGAGCMTEWRVAGPFGPRELLGFDQTFPAEARGALAAEYDLGPARGRRATRDVQARGCVVNMGAGPIAAGGTTIAEGHLRVDAARKYTFRLETPNAVQLFIDGERVASLDSRTSPLARTTHHSFDLGAGDHEIKVKLVSRHPNPVMVLSATPATTTDVDVETMRSGVPEFDAYGQAIIALARGNAVAAREAMRIQADRANATGASLLLRASIALGDPLIPADVRRDDARRFYRAAAQRDPEMWQPVLQLARLQAADGQVTEAIADMRTAQTRWPTNIAIAMSLAEMLLDKDWEAEADRTVVHAHEVVPGSCIPLRSMFDAARRRGRFTEARALADQIVACDSRSYVKLSALTDAREWDAARVELERLSAYEPSHTHTAMLASTIEMARGRGDAALLLQSLRALAVERPLAIELPLAMADLALAQNQNDEAIRILDEAISREPSAMGDLRWIRRAIGGIDDIAPFRKNGTQILADFIAANRTYREPQVLVFDYAATRVFEDGSTIELVHQIYKAQSEEAVDELGDFTPPEGAQILTLRTIKADGRRMEPDQIAGKDSISLPSVGVGDYVEHEYMVSSGPSSGFPGGFIGNRFFFRSFEEPFDLSQQVVALPRSMTPVIDSRGPAPRAEERIEGDLRILTFTVHESRPLQPEPNTISAREFLPSVNVGVGATWDLFIAGMRDELCDKSVRDPAAMRIVEQIVGNDELSAAERARRIYAWVLTNIEASDDFFGSAPIMLAAHTGHRARVMQYLLVLAGLDADLVATRNAGGDTTRSEMADPETYSTALVRVRVDSGWVWLSPADRGAPFGYVPRLLRDQDGIVLNASGDHVRVRGNIANEDLLSVEVDVRLGDDSTARIDVVETLHGAGAIAWRNQLENIPAAELERRFEEGYVARLVPGAVLAALEIQGRDENEAPLVMRYSFDVRGYGRHVGGRWVLSSLFPTQLQAAYAQRAARTLPELIATPLDRRLVVRFHASSDALPAALPEVRIAGPQGASVHIVSAVDGDKLTITRDLSLPLMRIEPADYPAFAVFCRQADEAESRELTFRM
ncbi:MAG: hypothetical protein IPK60_13295 [Sandaracinaceae bacterium]|nr:hypothetical protein [Sandaracinaceae bacterium]